MKTRNLFTVVCICLLVFVVMGCGVETGPSLFPRHNFRSFDWGAKDYLIKKEESSQLIYEGTDRLMYWDSFMGYNSNITYCFYDSKLNHGYISIDSNDDKSIIYATIAAELKSIYGDAIKTTQNSMKFVCKDNSTIYLTKDGKQVAVLFTEK